MVTMVMMILTTMTMTMTAPSYSQAAERSNDREGSKPFFPTSRSEGLATENGAERMQT